MMPLDAGEQLGYLETIGRTSGLPRETEIWWVADDDHVYLMSGGGARKDWIRNFRAHPQVRFRVGDQWVSGTARIEHDETAQRPIRELMAAKYYSYVVGSGDPLPNDWCRTALPVVITLDGA